MKGKLAAVIVWWAYSWSSSNPNIDISSHNPSYEVLRRIQTRSTSIYYSQNYPVRINRLKPYLESQTYSGFDRHFLSHQYPFGNKPLVDLVDSNRMHSFYLSPLIDAGYAEHRYDDSTYRSGEAGLGLRVYGEVKSSLVFFSRGRVFTEKTNKEQYSHQFDPDFGETCSVEKGAGDSLLDTRTCNRFEHYLFVDLPWFELKLGRDHLHMGPGYFSSLTAGRETPPYYLIEARIDFSNWFFLDNYFLKMTDTDHDVRKYAHIHRFEFKPSASLSLAFQDAVIYQERDPDLKYILPLTPLAFSEDNNGGRDNDAMSFDVMFTGVPGLSVWGEVFIDDLLGPGAFFDDFWENRWAVLSGFQVVSPWPGADLDLVVEYSRVEPWTYTGRQDYTSFKHFNVPSASKLGPNSRSLDVKLSYRPFSFIEISEHFELTEKGSDRGSSLKDIHDSQGFDDPDTKDFLGGNTVEKHRLTHSVSGFWDQYLGGNVYVNQVFGDQEYFGFGGNVTFSW
ncbi:capsule assembly Wzi family protein [Fibrobacterota bacterium]